MRVQKIDNKKVYKVIGTYFNKEKGEGKIYFGDMNGRPVADTDLESLMRDYEIADDSQTSWETTPIPVVESKLANLQVALTDYYEFSDETNATVVDGKKKYFTYNEAMEVQKNLEDRGWRLPTRSEWVLLCEEFGQDDDGLLSPKKLEENLRLIRGGSVHLDTGSLRYAGGDSYYWSATTYPSATNAYYLAFNSTNVYPSDHYNRFYGFSVRLVRDKK